jgi:hypothetical protein
LRFEPPPQEVSADEAAAAPPRPRTPAPTTPFAPAQPTAASTPFRLGPPEPRTAPPEQRTAPPEQRTASPEQRPASPEQRPASSAPRAVRPEVAPEVPVAPAKKATPATKTTPVKKAAVAKKAAKAQSVEPKPVAPAPEPVVEVEAPAKKAAPKKAAVKKAVVKKAAPVKKAAKAVKAVKAVEAPEPVEVAAVSNDTPVVVAPAPEADEAVVSFRAGDINPAFLPEMLALAAVERLGAAAQRRISWYRMHYPDADRDAVSRAVTREFVRRARAQGFAAGLAGTAGLLIEPAGIGWLQAKLVLHLAAAYGHDPEDRRRAAELLVLQRVHGTVETAEAAVRAAEQAGAARRANPRIGASRMTAPLARLVGAGIARAAVARVARRIVPGAGAIVGSVSAARGTERLAARAVRYYRRG